MKLDNKILLSLLIIGFIMFIFLLCKELKMYQTEVVLTRKPFYEINILNQKVSLNNVDKFYKNEVDCTNLKQNEQIVSYKLNEGKESYRVITSVEIFGGNKILTDNYDGATNIVTRLIVKDDNNKYEQIYIVESICQQGEVS